MPTVYIETSIVSYLRQRPSPQVVIAAHQLMTHHWWNDERQKYELVTSQYVLDEAASGDPLLAQQRLQSLAGIPLLPLESEVGAIATELVSRAILPQKALVDALHIALASFHGVEYLITWNCKHTANARILPLVRELLLELGHSIPIICTPEELLNDENQ